MYIVLLVKNFKKQAYQVHICFDKYILVKVTSRARNVRILHSRQEYNLHELKQELATIMSCKAKQKQESSEQDKTSALAQH